MKLVVQTDRFDRFLDSRQRTVHRRAGDLLQVYAFKIRELARQELLKIPPRQVVPGQKVSSRARLASTLWSHKGVTGSRHKKEYNLGWGKSYGPVLEWGPEMDANKAGWWISPGKTSSVLRWYAPKAKKIMYSKKPVWHPWSPSQLRPHFAPALDKVRDEFFRDVVRL